MTERDAQREVRVLVAVGINPNSERLLRTAARLADALGGRLLALHIAPPNHAASLYETNLKWQLEQARNLGAEVEIVQGSEIAATLVEYAKTRRATHLVIGQSDVSRWREVTRGSVINRLQRMILRERVHVDLYIVTSSSKF